MRRPVWVGAAFLLFAPLGVAGAQEELEEEEVERPAVCSSDSECPPWALCTVSLGECRGAYAPAEVCTGTCVAGKKWRVVARVGGVVEEGDEDAAPGATLGLEVIPPLAGGHLGLALEWWTRQPLKLSTTLTWPAYPGLVLGAKLGATLDPSSRTERWGSAVSARVEYFPWWPYSGVTPFHYLSFTLEGGLQLPEVVNLSGSRPFVSLGIGLWPRTW